MIIAAGVVTIKWVGMLDSAELQKLLRLDRLEGIPTTSDEISATILPAKPTENAAPYYRLLNRPSWDQTELANVVDILFLRPTLAHLTAAKDLLSKNKETLDFKVLV